MCLIHGTPRHPPDHLAEATWGADPLEYLGGFPSLQYDPEASFSTSLAANATVKWTQVEVTSQSCATSTAKAVLNVAFPAVDWFSLQAIYGWAALQYQAWARGTLFVDGTTPQTITLWTERLLEFYVDGTHHFGGDYYGYESVPLVLHLDPGSHTIDIRLVRDVRSMGGLGTPTIDVSIAAKVSVEGLVLASDTALLPDMVDGHLAGALGSVTLRNDGLEDAFVTGVSINDTAYFAWLAQPSSIRVVPGQTRPIAFVISCHGDCPADVRIDIEYNSGDGISLLNVSQTIVKRAITDPHKITFLNPGGMVSYAILRPPSSTTACPAGPDNALPILLQLHGAGVDADSDIMRHSFDPIPNLCAWGLYPTGSTTWSGDDWHTWGLADVEAAIASLPVWLDLVGWKGPGIDIERWFVVGHSNGGQGTWYTLTHRPDNAIAAAPISGYSSIQNYVPYHFWSPMDPAVHAILETSLGNFKHEQLLANAQGIPIVQQHGGADDNVPVYHSRLMKQLLDQAGSHPSYFEIEGKNHWFDGIMTTEPLKAFYEQLLGVAKKTMTPPGRFDFVVANPAAMGPKHGLSVLHLYRQGQLGRVEVSFDSERPTCTIKTTNVLSLRLPAIYTRTHDIIIDGQEILLAAINDGVDLWLTPAGSWKVSASQWKSEIVSENKTDNQNGADSGSSKRSTAWIHGRFLANREWNRSHQVYPQSGH